MVDEVDRVERKMEWLYQASPMLREERQLPATQAQVRALAERLCQGEDVRAAEEEARKAIDISGYDSSEIGVLSDLP